MVVATATTDGDRFDDEGARARTRRMGADASKPGKGNGGGSDPGSGSAGEGTTDGRATVAERGARGGRPRREGLTPLQLRGINALLMQPTAAGAAREVGVSPETISRWLGERQFSGEYLRQLNKMQVELWGQMLAVRSDVFDRFRELIQGDPKYALRACLWFLDRMLSVPAIVAHTPARDEDEVAIPPEARALLERLKAVLGDDEEAGS